MGGQVTYEFGEARQTVAGSFADLDHVCRVAGKLAARRRQPVTGHVARWKATGVVERTPVHRLDQIPPDMTPTEAAKFWRTHTVTRELWARLGGV